MTRFQLDDIPLFAALSDDVRERVMAVARRERLKAGDVVTDEGAVSYYFFAIASGTADVHLHGELVAQLGPGDFFGEMGTLPHEGVRWLRRSARVTATSKLTVLAIPDEDLRQLVEQSPSLGELLRNAAQERERQNRERDATTTG
jgi:CRP-like cAMP-binding protein